VFQGDIFWPLSAFFYCNEFPYRLALFPIGNIFPLLSNYFFEYPFDGVRRNWFLKVDHQSTGVSKNKSIAQPYEVIGNNNKNPLGVYVYGNVNHYYWRN